MRWRAIALLTSALAATFRRAAANSGCRASEARGIDGYLWDAENVYANRPRQPDDHRRTTLDAGLRGYLALFYNPPISILSSSKSPKRQHRPFAYPVGSHRHSCRASSAPAGDEPVGVAAFGYFIFKAPHAQSELLFYFFLFVAFLGCCTCF
jgi:hypothetical protein